MALSRIRSLAVRGGVLALVASSALGAGSLRAAATPPVGASLDPTYSSDGIVTADFGQDDGAFMAVQTDNKAVVLDTSYASDDTSTAFLKRFNAAGAGDVYGSGGRTQLVPGPNPQGFDLALDSSNNSVSVGSFGATSDDEKGFIAKANSSGNLLTAFDTDGYVVEPGVDSFQAGVLQADGKVVAVGPKFNTVTGNNDVVIARYTTAGAPDPTFSGDGYLTVTTIPDSYPYNAALDGDGNFWFTASEASSTVVGKVAADGSLVFEKRIAGVDGGSDQSPAAINIIDSSDVLIGAETGGHPAIAKVDAGGNLIPAFGTNGLVIAPFAGVNGHVTDVATGSENRIYASFTSDTNQVTLGALHADGTIDRSFDNGGDGILTTPIGGVSVATTIAFDSSHRLVIGGSTAASANADGDVAVARYIFTAGAPTAPTKVSTIAQNNGDAKVQWDYPDNDGGVTPTGYTIQTLSGTTVATAPGDATSAVIHGLSAGTLYSFKVVVTNSVGSSPASEPSNESYTTGSNTAAGYYLVASDGGVFSEGTAPFYGSSGNIKLNKPIVDSALTSTGAGYWLVASDGGVFSYGDATFKGSAGNIKLNKPIVGAAATPTGGGYWLVASDGGVFSYGDATFYGSTGNIKLNKPIVDLFSTPTGKGYWLVASDGGIFAYGDAVFFGSTGAIKLNQPIVGAVVTPSAKGYWLVASDGGVFSYGDATFYGSTGAIKLNKPIVGVTASPSGHGYMMTATDGGVFAFGDYVFRGSTGNIKLNQPIVSAIRN